MTVVNRLVRVIADGQWHSGESLGISLGVTRAAIWKQVKVLAERGLYIERSKSLGYRLVGGLTLLDDVQIMHWVGEAQGLKDVECHFQAECADIIASTNAHLLAELSKGQSIHARSIFAEAQTAGRGRRLREWHSPYAQNIYLSLGWHFSGGIGDMQGLSLAVSVVIAQAIESVFGLRVDLKWPNDILYQQKKLGGILLEIGGDLSDECAVVIGVGLNVNMLHSSGKINQPWISLRDIIKSAEPLDRNMLGAQICVKLCRLLSYYAQDGFAYYRKEWEQYCPHIGCAVDVHSGSKAQSGIMKGVTDQGELVLSKLVGGAHVDAYIHGGEVSLRAK